jgi:hypothetical protein
MKNITVIKPSGKESSLNEVLVTEGTHQYTAYWSNHTLKLEQLTVKMLTNGVDRQDLELICELSWSQGYDAGHDAGFNSGRDYRCTRIKT